MLAAGKARSLVMQAVRVGVPVALFHAETEAVLCSDTFRYDARKVDLRDRHSTAPVWISTVPSLMITSDNLDDNDFSPEASIRVVCRCEGDWCPGTMFQDMRERRGDLDPLPPQGEGIW